MQKEGRPLIGITCGVSTVGFVPRAAGGMRYAEAIQAAGGTPVFVPPMTPAAAAGLLSRLDGLLLAGGGDIDPMLYGERPVRQVAQVEPARDATELLLAREAIKAGMPVLGVCRGLQVINVALGGTLIQDLPTQRRSDIRHAQQAPRHQSTHTVTLEPGSVLGAISQEEELSVNSFHHQAVRELGAGLRACAWAPDGVVEGLEGEGGGFLVAVQWHPEELWESHPPSQRLFERFVQEARRPAGAGKSSRAPQTVWVSGGSGGSFRIR